MRNALQRVACERTKGRTWTFNRSVNLPTPPALVAMLMS